MLNRSKILAAALLVAVFAAGIAVGAAASAAWGDRTPAPASTERPERRESRRDRSYLDWLDEELTLTPVQRDTVKHILEGYQGSMHEIWIELRPRMDTIRLRVRQQIMPILDSTQQDRYRALIARSDSGRRGERGREEKRDK